MITKEYSEKHKDNISPNLGAIDKKYNYILEKFSNGGFRQHPVWILLRDIDEGLNVAKNMIDSVRDSIGYNDAKTFELTRATLPELYNFLSLKPLNFRIASCVIRSQDEFLNSAILKKIEDVPEDTVFIVIAHNLNQTLRSRGLVFQMDPNCSVDQKYLGILSKYPGFDKFYNMIDDFDLLPNTINEWLEENLMSCIRKNNAERTYRLYEAWKKFVDIRTWIESEQITRTAATEMMLSILHLSSILG